jgi:hypothetical protein
MTKYLITLLNMTLTIFRSVSCLFNFSLYSVLKASTGERREAFQAG